MTVEKLAEKYGLEFLGFLTLTFADHVIDPAEAQRRLNSLITNVIRHRYREYVCVFERQKSGRIHYHLLVVLKVDIRTGVDFGQFAAGNYGTAPNALKSEWVFWRKVAKKFSFGRTELLPVRSNQEAISKYVGKYISKHIGQRKQEDKGVRLVRVSKGARVGTTKFAWGQSAGSWLWRAKVGTWAKKHGCANIDEIAALFGPRWAYLHEREILQTELNYWPTVAHAREDGQTWVDDVPEDAVHFTRAVRAQEADPVWRVPVPYKLDRNPETCRLYRARIHRQIELPTSAT